MGILSGFLKSGVICLLLSCFNNYFCLLGATLMGTVVSQDRSNSVSQPLWTVSCRLQGAVIQGMPWRLELGCAYACHIGCWLGVGKPQVSLMDFFGMSRKYWYSFLRRIYTKCHKKTFPFRHSLIDAAEKVHLRDPIKIHMTYFCAFSKGAFRIGKFLGFLRSFFIFYHWHWLISMWNLLITWNLIYHTDSIMSSTKLGEIQCNLALH